MPLGGFALNPIHPEGIRSFHIVMRARTPCVLKTPMPITIIEDTIGLVGSNSASKIKIRTGMCLDLGVV